MSFSILYNVRKKVVKYFLQYSEQNLLLWNQRTNYQNIYSTAPGNGQIQTSQYLQIIFISSFNIWGVKKMLTSATHKNDGHFLSNYFFRIMGSLKVIRVSRKLVEYFHALMDIKKCTQRRKLWTNYSLEPFLQYCRIISQLFGEAGRLPNSGRTVLLRLRQLKTPSKKREEHFRPRSGVWNLSWKNFFFAVSEIWTQEKQW